MRRIGLLAVLLVLLPVAAAAPQPEPPPPTGYGWVYYPDGTPAPSGLRVVATCDGHTWMTRTGRGVVYPNAYQLTLDVPGAEEDCTAEIYVNDIRAWSGHIESGDILEINITLPASANTSTGSAGDLVRLAATAEHLDPGPGGGGFPPRNSGRTLLLAGLGLAALLLFLMARR